MRLPEGRRNTNQKFSGSKNPFSPSFLTTHGIELQLSLGVTHSSTMQSRKPSAGVLALSALPAQFVDQESDKKLNCRRGSRQLRWDEATQKWVLTQFLQLHANAFFQWRLGWPDELHQSDFIGQHQYQHRWNAEVLPGRRVHRCLGFANRSIVSPPLCKPLISHSQFACELCYSISNSQMKVKMHQ